MGNAVFPNLPGMKAEATAAPTFSTKTQRAVSGRELRAAFMQYPLWNFDVSFEFLRDTAAFPELDTLAGFFLSRQGSFDSFLFQHPADYTVTDMQFGVGNGTQTQFQLTRTLGAGGFTFVEPVQNVNVLTNIKKAGVAQSSPAAYSISSTGLVTFTSAPANGEALTWTGTYYYRCRFVRDAAEFQKFMQDLWELKKLDLVGAPGNKV